MYVEADLVGYRTEWSGLDGTWHIRWGCLLLLIT